MYRPLIMDSYIAAYLSNKIEVYNFVLDVDSVDPKDLIRFHDRATNYIHKIHPDCQMCQVMNYDQFLSLRHGGVIIHLDPNDFAPDLIPRDTPMQ